MGKLMYESRSRVLTAVCLASSVLLFSAGCASGGGSGSLPADTHATLLITATNNAKIPIFKFNIQTLTLLADDGTSVPILTTPQLVELGSINGVARPLVTIDIPQKTYVSVNLAYGPSNFVVIDRSAGPGNIDTATYKLAPQTAPTIAVKFLLKTPLVITGSAMGMLLNLNIPQSTTYTPFFDGSSTLAPGGGDTTFNPVFSISAVTLAANPSTLQDGKVEDVHGQVTANSDSALTIATDSGSSFTFDTPSSTVFTGVSGATPPIGSYVDVDAALEADGSMLATHIQTEATSLQYDMIGQVIDYTSQTYIASSGREQQGPNLVNEFYSNYLQIDMSTQFEISWPGGTAPAGLPFTPTLNAESILPGQNIATPIESLQSVGNVYPVPNIVTLEPQTINGTVAAISNVSGQTSYQITLFNDDLIALFGSTQTVAAYSTAETHTITTSPLSVGSVARVRGLLFDDGGTLRMVATEIEDGVPGSGAGIPILGPLP
jgi:Domain of unknown function (DUF5666)